MTPTVSRRFCRKARYNQSVKKCALAVFVAVFVVVLASCSKNIQNPDAVKEGVIDYLKQRAPTMGLDMSAMDVNVGSISFEKDIARANVSFVPKGMPPGSGGMTMDYVLERKGDKWAVKGRQVSPGNAHGDQALPGDLPPGHPPTGQAPTGQAK
jgi:hypothetical protein